MKLRPYQQKAVDDTRKSLTKYKSPCLILPCGGGKSVICGHIARLATDKGNKVLFVVHVKELIDQIKDTFNVCGVNMNLCDISMIQSTHKLNDEDYKIIITDEAHHASSKTYLKLYEKYPKAFRVNVTATPCRNDSKGLGLAFDTMINTVSVKWLIDNKFLAPFKYYSINLMQGELKKVGNDWGGYRIHGDYLKYYKPGSKAIVYCSSIEHSMLVTEAFKAKGISCMHIDGNVAKNERKDIINKFRSGDIKVLCNFSLLGEGLDIPDCDSVFLLRKTSSLNLFIQMSMRCMRYRDNKTAYIYDFCGNCFEHGLPDEDRKWSLDHTHKHARNSSSEPDILVRQCKNCMRVYEKGIFCPYCGFENGKTLKEIKEDKEAELIEIKKIGKEEVRKAITYEDLLKIERERGYKKGWAKLKYNNSWRNKL